jgi:predicted dehydrogenase
MQNHHDPDALSRRHFIKGVAASAAIVSFPNIIAGCASTAPKPRRLAANERINVASIGTGNQGTNDIKSMIKDERIQFVAVCDVNRESAGYWDGAVAGREPARKLIEKTYGEQKTSGTYKGCDTYTDFRKMLQRKDIDVIMIATPDHWHAIMATEACKAGKDVYCQKPLSLTIGQGRAMADAVKKYKRVLQTGSQQRSERNFHHACELVRNGRIGKLQTVKVGQPGGHTDFGKTGNRKAPEAVPEGFDYNMWLGPAPMAPYCPARTHVNFRWNYDYSGGQLTDWGGHHPDIAQWGMGTERTGPVEIRNPKATFPPRTDLWNTATAYYFEAIYENGVKLIVSDAPDKERGVTFTGTEGKIFVTRGRQTTTPESLWEEKIGENEIQLYKSTNHFRNFIDCVLSRKEPIAPAEIAHRSITIAHLGNISMKLGRDLKWDPARERFLNDAEANKMLNREMRAPWKLA